MKVIDTHIHWYAEAFDEDREEAIQRAVDAGVDQFLLPAIDSSYESGMKALSEAYPGRMHLMGGLHPTHVKDDFEKELDWVRRFLDQNDCKAVGEIGIDLYWDRTHESQQRIAFRTQILWALERDLPIVIHCREAFDAIFEVMEEFRGTGLRGVFHCFTGDRKQADHALGLGFHLGIGGVLTFKRSDLKDFIAELPLDRMMLETDAPYLAPVPYRGKRNEGSYLLLVLEKMAEAYGLTLEEVASRTYENSVRLFDL